MIVTLKWLSDFVDLSGLTAEDIAKRFIEIGFEVEEMKNLSKGMERVKVGRIVKLTRHPNADKLQICTINLGGGEQVQILTAATNVFEGALVPCALDGADLPNGVKIKTTNMRGENSQGMLCSGEELKIDDSVYPNALVDGIMILDESAKEGQPIAEFLGLDDVIFDIKVLANRPDCQSVIGLAKELAAGLNREFKEPKLTFSTAKEDLELDIDIKTQNCPVYLGCVVKDITIQDSPKIIQKRLKAIGLNPKNNIIDLTNYVLWEMGQPLHAFDYDKIKNHKIIVRNAQENEVINGLNGKEYKLNSEITVIADSEKPIGIAGIMGGKDFSISAETKNIVIESAIFDRVNIRRGARSLGVRTDASARYERGVETISAKLGMQRVLSLIEEFKIGKICPTIIQKGEIDTNRRVVELDTLDLENTLGIQISNNDIVEILSKLDIQVEQSGTILKCYIPAIRADIERPADIIEEIIRFYGYDKITPTYCENTKSIAGGMSVELQTKYDATNYMLASGAHQVKTYSFRSPLELDKLLVPTEDDLRNFVKIENPLSLDYSVMRTQLLSSLLSVVKLNESRKNTDIQIFEIGKIFKNERVGKDNLPIETNILGYLVAGKQDFFDTKSITEMLANKFNLTFTYKQSTKCFMHPNICADILIGNKVIGFIGKVHPQVLKNFDINADCHYFEINMDLIPAKKVKKVKPLPKYPSAHRDLAIVVDESVRIGDLIESIKKTAGNTLDSLELFDIYEGEQIEAGKKSVAFKMLFRKQDATMTQEEVNQLFDKILNTLSSTFNAQLRL